jgi:hypothetical protein
MHCAGEGPPWVTELDAMMEDKDFGARGLDCIEFLCKNGAKICGEDSEVAGIYLAFVF